jgi:Cu(I)/Ag(I) efflux system protein CusF
MKKFSYSALVTALLLPATAVLAQQKMGDMKPMDSAMKPLAEAQATHKATGVVKKVDPKTGVVTLSHEAVISMNWPPMTMGFMVNDKMLLDRLPVGKKVDFEVVRPQMV